MRIIVAVLFLMVVLSGCTFLKRSGDVVCEAHQTAAEGISTAGGYLGGPGNLVADILNAGLEMFCKVYKAIVSTPADIADGPGTPDEVTSGEAEHADHP